jgi:uncharacterized protein
MNIASPVNQSERIIILDSLRGVAVLGILLMNIQGFGLPELQIFDVSALKEAGLNYFTWYVFGPGVFEGSMRAIFSMLFGAGVIIFISRLEKRKKRLVPVAFFFRRQLWLLLFGLFNIYILLWPGDILFNYAICGLFLFPLRKLKPHYLFIITGACLLLITARENLELYKEKAIIVKGERIAAVDTTKAKLTEDQNETLTATNEIIERSKPEEKIKRIEKQIAGVRGNYSEVSHARSKMDANERTSGMYYYVVWDILVFMFLGMAFYKTGILQGEADSKLYAWMAAPGLCIGLPLSYFYLQPQLHYQHNYFQIIRHQQFEFYELQRFIRSIGIFGLVMVFYKSGLLKRFFSFMQPVGQMAFTNYLMQSFLCGLFFYGVGFGMFGQLQRYELYYVVAAVWIIEIIWSHIWLRHFRFGPLEWLWRSLTYWKIQPLRKTN